MIQRIIRGLLVTGGSALSACWLASCAAPAQRPLLGPEPKAACESLVSAVVGADRIAWPGQTSGAAKVDSATWEAVSPLAFNERAPFPGAAITPATPNFCKVVGRIAAMDPKADPIMFQVNLPVAWNGRSVQFGGGGFNGTQARHVPHGLRVER